MSKQLFFPCISFIITTIAIIYSQPKRKQKKIENQKNAPVTFRILIHGGAGVIDKGIESSPYYSALFRILKDVTKFANESAKSAIDIVEFAVVQLEDEPLFNAGRGSVFTAKESHELEASIMNGDNLTCGAVSMVTNVKNPVKLARKVMENTKHIYIVGNDSLNELANQTELDRVDNSHFSTDKRRTQLHQAKKLDGVFVDHSLEQKALVDSHTFKPAPVSDQPGGTGTVGCVAFFHGHIAAATSTGGMTNKMSGRVGDTPIIGAGTYANDKSVAVSATGIGEEFMRHCAAHEVSARVLLGGRSTSEATKQTVFDTLPPDSGGLIVVDAQGNYSMEFNTPGMFRGICDSNGLCKVGIWEEMIE